MKAGDIFIEVTGWGCDGKRRFRTGNLFEYNPTLKSGEGRIYDRSGESSSFFWAVPKEENKVIGITDQILFSFRHGVWHFKIDEDEYEKCKTPLEILQKSDIEILSKEKVESAKLAEKCNTIELIKENIDTVLRNLSAGHILLMYENIGIKYPECTNGEIGIWSMMLFQSFARDCDYLLAAVYDDDTRIKITEAMKSSKFSMHSKAANHSD